MNLIMFVQKTSFFGIILVLMLIGVLNSNAFDIDKDLVFRLYVREEPFLYYTLKPNGSPSISETLFNGHKPTRFFIHGYKSKEKVINRYRDAFLDKGDFNFIAVDWIEGANDFNYLDSKGRIGAISKKLAELIDALVEHGMQLRDVTMVGHSLGAHIAGLAAKQIKSEGKIGAIIGLDPAGPGFDFFAVDKRLALNDADYVEIIHTDGDKWGILEPMGQSDFYPNGGEDQPGCDLKLSFNLKKVAKDLAKCDHVRAHHLYLESLKTPFEAIQCVSQEEIHKHKCTFNNVTAIMGGDITPDTPKSYGIFYLETKASEPYVIPDYRSFNNVEFITYQN